MAFNRNQKRDRNGKWTSGGASKAKSAVKKSSLSKKQNRRRVATGAVLGGTIGFLGTLGTPVGAAAGAAVGAGIVARKNRKSRKR